MLAQVAMVLPQHASQSALDPGLMPSSPIASLAQASHNPVSTGDWSSLIGIVTAIIGNVLISFALNTQRYAHVRLQREARGQSRSASRTQLGDLSNGQNAQLRRQSKIAEELSRKNAQSIPDRDDDGQIHSHDRSRETDPLLPKSRGSESSASSISSPPSSANEKDDEEPKKKNYLKSPFWWLGISLMFVGEAGNFLAYGFAPASIVSPLGVVALISNCLIAPIMLKEPFRKRDVLGVIIAVGGAVTVVLSAKGSNPKLGPHQIWTLISRWEFLTYLGITLACIIALMFASNKYGDRSVMIDIGLVGLFGGYTALATKGVASLLSYRLLRVFTFPITYLLVAVLVGTAIMQIKYVNRALQHFNSTQVIPTQFVFFTIFVVVGSAVLYRDFEKTTAEKVAQFIGGVGLTFLGVWCITSGRTNGSNTDLDSEADEDEEQGIVLVDEEGSEDDEPRVRERLKFDPRDEAESTSKRPQTPSPPSTPRAQTEPTTPYVDSPASFATAASHIGPTPGGKPRMAATVSSPLLPSQHARSRPSQGPSSSNPQVQAAQQASSTLQVPSPSTPSQRPQPPRHTNSDTTVTPLYGTPASAASSSVPRQLLNRHSITSGMLPGPYTSPLSAGLSVLVADSRRRDEQVASSIHRRRSTRQSRSQSQTLRPGALVALSQNGTPTGGSAVQDDVLTRRSTRERRSSSVLAEDAGISVRARPGGRDSLVEPSERQSGGETKAAKGPGR